MHKFITKLYEIAIHPERHWELHNLWETEIIQPLLSGGQEPVWLDNVEGHIRHATELFEINRNRTTHSAETVVEDTSRPTIVVDRYGRILGRSEAVDAYFGLEAKGDIHALNWDRPSLAILRQIAVGQFRPDTRRHLLSFETREGMSRLASFGSADIEMPREGFERPYYLITGASLDWPDSLDRLIAARYGFSATEIAIAKALFVGRKPAALAKERGVSVETIRSQIRDILRKTETQGQAGFNRFIAGILSVMPVAPDTEACSANPPRTNCHPSMERAPLDIGDRGGVPVVILSASTEPASLSGLEVGARRAGLRLIIPYRPPRPSDDRLAYTEMPADIIATLNALGLERALLVGFFGSGIAALEAARRYPQRTIGCMLVNTGLPFRTLSDFSALPGLMRRTRITARLYAQGLYLPFKIVGSYLPNTERGADATIAFHFLANPADYTLVAENPKIQAKVQRDLAYAYGVTEHLLGTYRAWSSDWSASLESVLEKTPVTLLHGGDQQSPRADSVIEAAKAYPDLDLVVEPGCADLLIYAKPDAFLRALCAATRTGKRFDQKAR